MKRRWSSRSIGSRLQHNIFYTLIKLAGVRPAYALLALVVTWYTLRPSIRNRSRAYIKRRFPGSGFFARFKHTWLLQWNFGQCLVDRAAAGILGRFSFDKGLHGTLDSLIQEGRGLILLAAHTGCWQMAPYLPAQNSGAPVSILVHREAADIDKQAHEHSGKVPPFAVINAADGLAGSVAITKLLRHGGLLCMMGDRVLGNDAAAVPVSFLGGTALMAYTPYRLASSLGVPLALVFAVRTGPLQGKLHFAHVLRVPEGLGTAPERYTPFAQRFACALERFTQEYPHQFFNFYDLWES